MTKEELEKEAEKGLDKRLGTYAYINKQNCYRNYVDGYIDGAEPREKRIEELIALINAERERQEKCDAIHLRTIAELENENAELKQADEGKVVEHFEAYGQCRDSRRIAELEEKLKHAEENCINKTCVVFKDKEDCVAKLLELEKENAELKEKSSRQSKNYKCDVDKLLEENAELKSGCGMCYRKDKEQLTKAKQIIQEFLELNYSEFTKTNAVFLHADKFLKETK